jgi:hypothetical protein
MDGTRNAADRRRLLRIYLNDHLMGAVGGAELARRCLNSNRGTPLGTFLEQLHREIVEDRATLNDLMTRMEFPADRIKVTAAALAEKAARLKLNGRLLGYSDLSRLIELEGLCAGVALKLRLWRVLKDIAVGTDPRLAATDFDPLIERATAQLDGLEQHRLEAARRAFT